MMRSMFSGVSGLRTHQAKMDVIGNNIANVNTVGYKGTSVQFEEIYSQTIRGAGSPQGGRGGTNPQQVGLGVNTGTMNVNHTTGSIQRTDNPTDVMISGNGFFRVTADPTYQDVYYTRAGNFTRDEDGFLVTGSGMKVLGDIPQTDLPANADNDSVTFNESQPIVIDKTKTVPAKATTKVTFTGNIDFDAYKANANDPVYSTTVDVYDALGNKHTIGMEVYESSTDANTSTRRIKFSSIDVAPDGKVTKRYFTDAGDIDTSDPSVGADFKVKFDKEGKFVEFQDAGGSKLDNAKLVKQIPGTDPVELKLMETVNGKIKANAFEALNHFSGTSDAVAQAKDGKSAGVLNGFNISSAGEVIGSFTNGMKLKLGIIKLATFDNNAGLQKFGSNLFQDTANSGAPKVGTPSTSSFGKLATGALEMSNVDLSQQFTEMITTQRGFQANSRVITTSDEMLQELVNLKR